MEFTAKALASILSIKGGGAAGTQTREWVRVGLGDSEPLVPSAGSLTHLVP